MPVFKATYTVTILGKFDTPEEAEEMLANNDLESLLAESTDGALIGDWSCNRWDEVPEANVKAELVAINNDGLFFDLGDLEEVTDDE